MIVLTISTKSAWFTLEVITIFSLCFSICLHRKKINYPIMAIKHVCMEKVNYPIMSIKHVKFCIQNLGIIGLQKKHHAFWLLSCNWCKGIGTRYIGVQNIIYVVHGRSCKIWKQEGQQGIIPVQCYDSPTLPKTLLL